jgi:hypothetical protein
MARKKLKNAAKIAAALGAAYALSKMGKGTMDGTEGDFPASSTAKASPVMSDYDSSETEGGAIPTDEIVNRYRANTSPIKRFLDRNPNQNPSTILRGIGTDSYGMQSGAKKGRMMKAKAGGSVHVKTKIGYSKPTKIC